jgi:enoyl-CoA hydratase/carnithine racemase
MTEFREYSTKYACARMSRRDGILQLTLHTDDGPFQWGFAAHEELPRAFADIGADRDNRVVIVTGVGATFSAPQVTHANVHFGEPPTPQRWDVAMREGRHLIMNLLDIDVPIISAVNGPAFRHSELALLNDIVLCTEDTTFEDSAHFSAGGLVPGDGVHVMFPLLLGINRARYFMLTGKQLDANLALELGLVAEIVPRDRLLDRAFELAGEIASKPPLLVRYARLLLTQQLKRQMLDYLGYGLALEGLATMDRASFETGSKPDQ